jgi:ABC-type phosphate transport system substrate-binding protein
MSSIKKKGLVLTVAGAIAMGIIAQGGTAFADSAPQSGDVVGVGSDTVQYIGDFGADGDVAGDLGYNSTGNVNRLYSIDATPDANARAGYQNGSTNTTLKPLNPTVVLRAGKNPVQRPNGSSAGIAALLLDTGATRQINFVRSSRLPKASEQSAAAAAGWGYLHVVQLATEPLGIATANTTDAPAGLSPAELVSIYSGAVTKWNQLPGNSSGSSATIVPLIPQAGSGTRSSFVADLQTANGGTAVTLGSNVLTVEENDPTAITNAASPADTIVPFSGSRLALYNAGYFHDPSVAYPGGAALTPGIKLSSGTPTDGNAVYSDVRGLYIIYRDSDRLSTTPFQPGSSKNFVASLFANNPASFFKSAPGQAAIAAAGATPLFADLGNVSSG